MKKTELIETLYKNDLNQFAFNIYEEKENSYTFTLRGSSPESYEKFLGSIGGNYEEKFTKRHITELVEDMI